MHWTFLRHASNLAVRLSINTAYIDRMKMHATELRVDRTVMTVTDLDQNDDDQYWQSRTPLERLQAIELNRQAVYGYRGNPPRFQKVLEVARR